MPTNETPYQAWIRAKWEERAAAIKRAKTAKELSTHPAVVNRPGWRAKPRRCCGGAS